jgi:hypothetical protein
VARGSWMLNISFQCGVRWRYILRKTRGRWAVVQSLVVGIYLNFSGLSDRITESSSQPSTDAVIFDSD